MTPYYEDEHATIYRGDALDVIEVDDVDPVLDILRRTAPVSVTVCPTCGGSGTTERDS